MASQDVEQLIDLTRRLAASVQCAWSAAGPQGFWRRQQRQFAARTGQEQVTAFATAFAQAVACGHCLVAAQAGAHLDPRARAWLRASTRSPLLRTIWRLCLTPDRPPRGGAVAATSGRLALYVQQRVSLSSPHDLFGLGAAPSTWPGLDFCERFLHHFDRQARRRRGVYTTPQELAGFVVRRVDALLRGEFGLERGLADLRTWDELRGRTRLGRPAASGRGRAPFVCLLDPAMGSGVFLLECITHLRRVWEHDQAAAEAPGWDQFVERIVLPRLWGQDVLLPAVASAHLLVTACLAATGYTFGRPAALELHLGNTLEAPQVGRHRLPRPSRPFTVIVGNPPFAGVSEHRATWLTELLHGRAPDGRAVASYLQVASTPLGERKHWLHDDYVKFLRLAHWLVEAADAGIVALVTNHAFLDNTTFRGLRAAVLDTFPRVSVWNLHGSARAAGRAPDGTVDESVFGIAQGVAVSLLRRPLAEGGGKCRQYGELWGARASKLATLDRDDPPAAVPLDPQGPYYLLVPHDRSYEAEYLRGYRLPDVMPVHGTAAVTARDSFVVGFTADELRERVAVLQDVTVPDAQVRQRFFTRGRSPHYLPGDTRGWRLADARQRLRQEADLDHLIRDCLYRPFDWRKVFWAPWMIDWPRPQLMEHLLAGGNLALVTRRQSPATRAWADVWITDTVALDGLIRADNRGSESVFPLYVGRPVRAGRSGAREANFSPTFVTQVARATGLCWRPRATAGGRETLTPTGLFHYIYALFHAPSFRRRYAPWLHVDFPRVFVPASAAVFQELAAIGSRLTATHLLRDAVLPAVPAASDPTPAGRRRHSREVGAVDANARPADASPAAREFRVGSYQVCRKWLHARRGRELTDAERRHYARLVAAVEQTLGQMLEVDRVIDAHGGWGRAFQKRSAHSSSSSARRAGS